MNTIDELKKPNMYRENIYSLLKKTGKEPEALLVPKNSGIRPYCETVLSEAGMDIGNPGIRVEFYRAEDIPAIIDQSFRKGRFLAGLTGDDLFDEYKMRNPSNLLALTNTYDWYEENAMFKRPALCLIGKGELPEKPRVAVNRKYKQTSRICLSKDFEDFDVQLYSGDTENTVANGLNDCCVEIVFSGETLASLGLQVIKKYRFSDLALISPLYGGALFGELMMREYDTIRNRKMFPKLGSQTSKDFEDPERITRKLNEEAYEVVVEFLGGQRIVPELADLAFRAMEALIGKDATLDDLALEILSRQKCT